MVYSQAKVIAGGLTHIPVVISVFYFVMTFFNKRALEFAEKNKSIKLKSKLKNEANQLITIKSETQERKENKGKEEKKKSVKELSNRLEDIQQKAEDLKEKVKKNKKKKKKRDMTRD